MSETTALISRQQPERTTTAVTSQLNCICPVHLRSYIVPTAQPSFHILQNTHLQSHSPDHARHPSQRVCLGRFTFISNLWSSSILLIHPTGPSRPSSNRPPRPNPSLRPIHSPHPQHGHQLLRPPANPWQVPTSAKITLDLRLRIQRRHHRRSNLQIRQQQVCSRRQSLRCRARRLR
jgi:hypothetical protein